MITMNQATNQGTKYKFPQAARIAELLKGNLAQNTANPEAIQAQQDARDIAQASGGTSPEVADRIAVAKSTVGNRTPQE